MDGEARGEIKPWCKRSSAGVLCAGFTHVQHTGNSSSPAQEGRPVRFVWDDTCPLP